MTDELATQTNHARLAEEKEQLTAEVSESIRNIIHLHGKTLLKKMQQTVYKDAYGTEIYDKFFVERDYFIKTVMIRGVSADAWSFFFSDQTPQSFFHQAFGAYMRSTDSETSTGIESTLMDLHSRPINEIMQQAEMLMTETKNLSDLMDEDGGGEKDPFYDQAVAVVLKNRKASISLVQRHLKIGYNRASRLMENMESAGLVSSMTSMGQREILVPPMDGRCGEVEAIDKTAIREMVEDYWRSFILLGHQNPSAGADLIKRFDGRIATMAALMDPEKAGLFQAGVEIERERLFNEYQRSPDTLKTRLNIQPCQQFTVSQVSPRRGQNFVGLVARTAVRATVWEIIRSLFRR